MAKEIVKRYDALVKAKRGEWVRTLDQFRDDLKRRRCLYGERALVHYLRPVFLTASEEAALIRAAEGVFSAVRKMGCAAMEDPALLADLDLSEGEQRLVSIDPLLPDPLVCARLDSFVTAEGPKFVELNAECPAGPGYSDVLSEAFLAHPLLRELSRSVEVRRFEERRRLLDTLLTVYRDSGGKGKPRIAIVDYDFLPTIHEFAIIAEAFNAMGIETVVVDPRSLSFDGGRLRHPKGAIDLVYRRVLTNEFLEKHDEVKALEDAMQARAVRVVNPFFCKVVHKKAIFALITGEGRERHLLKEEMEIVDAHVPWTRRVREMKTRHHGREVDLLPYLRDNRSSFVIKPNDEYGGKGVLLGWEVGETEWEAALRDAAKASYVVQERIVPTTEEFPAMARGLENERLIVDCDPYLYLGKMYGCLSRLSAGSLANVTSGGGQVPTFVVPDGL